MAKSTDPTMQKPAGDVRETFNVRLFENDFIVESVEDLGEDTYFVLVRDQQFYPGEGKVFMTVPKDVEVTIYI